MVVDDFGPTAVEERSDSVRIFFPAPAARDAAHAALIAAGYIAFTIDVDDEDWARRSQHSLKPITVGRITVAPPWAVPHGVAAATAMTIVIEPSMGFGTGHHATTRLCLKALQNLPLAGAVALDVGTGSGVLAMAASRLGAASVLGIDNDPDAIQSARENLALNPPAPGLEFRLAELGVDAIPDADVISANLTGALLVRSAERLCLALRPGGTLIVSGLLLTERDEVAGAFAPMAVAWEGTEDEWVGLALRRPPGALR